MDIEIRSSPQCSDVHVVHISGRLDVATCDQVAPRLDEAIEQSAGGVILDLRAVDFVSSAGLGVLTSARKSATALGKAFALLRPQPMIYKIFKVSDLDAYFDFFDNEDQAVAALRPA